MEPKVSSFMRVLGNTHTHTSIARSRVCITQLMHDPHAHTCLVSHSSRSPARDPVQIRQSKLGVMCARVCLPLMIDLFDYISQHSLETHLHACLRQVDLHRQVLAREHVRIVGLRERRLQLLQLLQRERGAIAPLFAPHERLVVYGRVIRVAGVCAQAEERNTHRIRTIVPCSENDARAHAWHICITQLASLVCVRERAPETCQ